MCPWRPDDHALQGSFVANPLGWERECRETTPAGVVSAPRLAETSAIEAPHEPSPIACVVGPERIAADPDTALDTLVREELGIDPEGLGGSPWVAAGTSFALFATGALVPLLPYLFSGGLLAVSLSGALTGVALFGSGAIGSLFTGQPILRTGLRHVAFGAAAAAVTYALGKLVGAGLGV
jgi:VIT1/CCC1 family predicted Fe2+/Mn2+ transporter